MSSNIATPLWQFRSLQNWAKVVLIKELCPTSNATVVQFGGGGLDTGKWERARINYLLSIEPDDQQSSSAEEKWIAKKSPFVAKFTTMEVTRQDFSENPQVIQELGTFSMVFCTDFFLERTMFRSVSDLQTTLQNIASLLKPGGVWCGFCVDSSAVWSKLAKISLPPSATKVNFFIAGTLIRIETQYVTNFFPSDPADLYPPQSDSDWSLRSPTYGIDLNITMENKSESIYAIHIPTLQEAAKEYGLRCASFRNLSDFYDTFKKREEDQLSKLGVFTKQVPKLLQDQRDAMGMFAVYVFFKQQAD